MYSSKRKMSNRFFSISLDQPFLTTLARGVLQRFGDNPLALARVEILLPNRRSCRAFAEILLKISGKPSLILPRIHAIGDADEDEVIAAISKPRRLLLYADRIKNVARETSLAWAEKLCDLQDECSRYDVSLETLREIFPEDVAAHRETLLSLLSVILEEPLHTQEMARNILLLKKAESLKSAIHPVIAAGSLGTIPATANLLRTIAQLPQGYVILPAYDSECGEVTRTHPQYAFQKLALTPSSIAWAEEQSPTKSKSFIRHWMQTDFKPQKLTNAPNIAIIEAETDFEEAAAIAIGLREALETPNKTAMLVTPDRKIARHVAAHLRKWDVVVDDSAGQPLSHTPLGSLFIRILDAALNPHSGIALLPMLKHPLCRFSREDARTLELERFRQNKKPKGDFFDTVIESLKPLSLLLNPNKNLPLAQLLSAHKTVLEDISGNTPRPESQATSDALNELLEAAEGIIIKPKEYPHLYKQLLAYYTYRPAFGTHPRIQILSPIEARLLSADRVIIANLNDTAWPNSPSQDWLGTYVRTQLGLPQHEDAISHAAHDFIQHMGAKEIILTRAKYVSGKPENAHPWLIRLKAIHTPKPSPYLAWVKEVFAAQSALESPAPCPPLFVRPTTLSATDIADLMQQPYRHYAKKILQLLPLEKLQNDTAQKEVGSAIHKALEDFLLLYPSGNLPELLQKYIRPVLNSAAEWALWQPRIAPLTKQFLEWDAAERKRFSNILPEISGSAEMKIGETTLTIKAKADRIAANDTQANITDYKTGTIPDNKDIDSGKSPQLLVEKWIIQQGGYNAPLSLAQSPKEISANYWLLRSHEERAKQQEIKPEALENVENELTALLELFYQTNAAYAAMPLNYKHISDPYTHLARIEEVFFNTK